MIDGSKGVEAQTIKLFKVCVLRHIPIFTFINKMDREARDPFELMSEIESVLGIHTCPVNWPIGCGKNFKGVYDRSAKKITTFTAAMGGAKEVAHQEFDLDGTDVDALIGADYHQQLKDEIELLDGASDPFDQEKVSAGELSPVFFGSALTNFGVEIFLKHFLKMTTSPLARKTAEGVVDPFDQAFSAFVFKIQANMNKAHRDRIAFMFEGIPTFAPEHFARVRQVDTMKRKQFLKGVSQIAQEGAIQIFQEYNTGMEEIIVGVVGELQFEVLTYRLENEYNVEVKLDKLPYEYIRWVANKEQINVEKIQGTSDMKRIKDLKDNPLLLFVNSWSVRMVEERNPDLVLSEFGNA